MPGMKQRIKDGLLLFLLRHSRFFDASFYRKQAGIPENEDAAAHYYRGGWRSADPSLYFPQENYLAVRPDVRKAEVCPLAHWLQYGRGEAFPGLKANRWHRYAALRTVRRSVGRLKHRKMIRRNRGTKILAAVHLSDTRAAKEIFEYLKNLRPYDWELVLTVPEGTDAGSLKKQADEICLRAEIRTAGNRGRDIAPWLEAIRSRDPDAFDIVMKIHPAEGRDRFVSGMEAVCGAGSVHENIDRLTQGASELAACGIRRDPPFRETLVNRELKPYGLALPAGYRFAESGIFAMRAETAAKIAGTGIRTEDFEPSGRITAPLTRAAERYITGCILSEGRPAPDAGPEAGKTIAFAVSETGSDAVAGDYFTALELAGALEKTGWKTKMLPRNTGDWYSVGQETDVLVSMLEDYDPGKIRDSHPGLLTIAWARNWFGKWAVSPALADYGILLASSGTAGRALEEKTGLKAGCFPIAANAERFGEAAQETDPAYRCDVCFTGNRFSPREIERELFPAELPYEIRIYGNGWEKAENLAPYCRGHLPYGEIPKVYRGAKIALDDATASTKETGSVNSRVFDALAAGCLVLTNNETGAEETFEGKLPVFRNREELESLLKRYLEDEKARQAGVEELRRFVLEKHTYEKRAKELEELIRAWRAGN